MTEKTEKVSEFQASVRRYSMAVAVSDVETVNRESMRMTSLFQQILTSPEDRIRLLSLLDHPDASVRLMVSAYGLGIDEESCVRVLSALAAEGPFRFAANQCLERWRNGEWQLDVPKQIEQDAVTGIELATNVDDVLSFGRLLPYRTSLSNIVDVERLDMRIGCVNVHFPNIVGVDVDRVEFCPNSEPPGDDEILAWTWVVRPDVQGPILEQVHNDQFAEAIRRLV